MQFKSRQSALNVVCFFQKRRVQLQVHSASCEQWAAAAAAAAACVVYFVLLVGVFQVWKAE